MVDPKQYLVAVRRNRYAFDLTSHQQMDFSRRIILTEKRFRFPIELVLTAPGQAFIRILGKSR